MVISSPRGWDGGIHIIWIRSPFSSFSYVSELLVCLDEGFVTTVLLFQGRCRNPFHSLRMYCLNTCPHIILALGFYKVHIFYSSWEAPVNRRSSIILGKIKHSEFKLDEVLFIPYFEMPGGLSRVVVSFLSLLKFPFSLKSLDTGFKSLVRICYLTNVRRLMKRAILSLNDIWKLVCFGSK